ncbi:MAG: 50S ribosomal protein L25 [Candidatus Aeolococcus gillhamiae]|uniref:Large ribosomal subunit protein bL25 n=1 Tax=Candidatus Aeolococcus gillhamiae TaxID=3127015 RepID=A0A2W5Z5D6_9BACT|nr:MAG: 50S ribosomal protein L25 [Candidatus Dormibacter sp. RRmetagenome_bin12]
MATIELPATTREERGSHNRPLRREGLVPAVLYGHNVEPRAITAPATVLHRVWMRAGRTQLIDLSVDGGRAQKVLVREMQIDPRTNRPIHADFFAVNLREKLTADVPVVVTGESPAVVDAKIGTLQQLVNTLRVECLPADLPAQFTVDVSGLDEIDAGIHVREITLPEGVELVHVDPDELVVKVAALRIVEEEPELAAAEEGEAPAEGEAAAESGEEAPAE